MIRLGFACVVWIWIGAGAAAATAAAPVGADAPTAGTFKNVRLAERSPLSSIEESFRRAPRQFTGRKVQSFDGMTAGEREHLDYDVSRESVDVVVPTSARDGSPHGLLVWMGVTPPDPQWFGSLAKRRLIWVTLNNCEGRSPWVRRGLAIDAVHNLAARYGVDRSRVYLAGFSAGAHASGELVAQFPDVFTGALCLMGGHYYEVNYVLSAGRDKTPTAEPTMLGPQWYGDVERLKRALRLVSVFGGADNVVRASYGRIDHECLRLDGFRHTYIELPGHGHKPPNLSTFQRALAALEAEPAPPPPPATQPLRGDDRPHADQLAQSRRLLTTAKMMYERVARRSGAGSGSTTRPSAPPAGDDARDATLARRYLSELLTNYPTTPAAADARGLLVKLDALARPATPPATSASPAAPGGEAPVPPGRDAR
jgi:predicted esterase